MIGTEALQAALEWCPRAAQHDGRSAKQFACGVCTRIYCLAMNHPEKLTREVVASINVNLPTLVPGDDFDPDVDHVPVNVRQPVVDAQQGAQITGTVVRPCGTRDVRMNDGTTTAGSFAKPAEESATDGRTRKSCQTSVDRGSRPATPPVPAQDKSCTIALAQPTHSDLVVSMGDAQSVLVESGRGGGSPHAF